jgi:hypothetical protein
MMFLNCPARLNQEGAVRCALPAEVRCRFIMRSSGAPLESVMIRCPAGHYFSGPIESLTLDSTDKRGPDPAGLGSRAGRDSLPPGHEGRGGRALRDCRATPERKGRRPYSAPGSYLGRPAGRWVTAMRPRRQNTASRNPMRAVTGEGQTPARYGGGSGHVVAGAAR